MLKPFIKEATTTTPEIKLDADNGTIELSGSIISVDTPALFDPILEWIDEYLNNPLRRTQIKLHLEYINTRASRYLLEVFKRIEKSCHRDEIDVLVKWICDKDDLDMLEVVEDYKALTDIPFEIVEN